MCKPVALACWVVFLVPFSAAGQTAADPAAVEVSPVPADEASAAPAEAMTLTEALHGLAAPAATDRRAAIVRLTELGDRTAVPNLMIVLRQDPDAEVRRSAAVALANLGDPTALPALQESAATDPSAAVRTTAAEAVGALGGTVSAAPPPVVAPPPPPPPPPPPYRDDRGLAGTALVFQSEDPGVEIHRVVAEHTIYVGGSHGGSGSAQSSVLICRTPCETSLPNGSYTLLADGYEFDVEARGGAQRWMVDGRSSFGYWSGFFLTILGATFAVTGGLMLGVYGEGTLYDMNLGFLIAGLAGMAIGIPVWVVSGGGAERMTGGGGGSAERRLTVGVAPGASAWNLALRLDL